MSLPNCVPVARPACASVCVGCESRDSRVSLACFRDEFSADADYRTCKRGVLSGAMLRNGLKRGKRLRDLLC